MKNEYVHTIQQLSFAFAKYHYENYLKEHSLENLSQTSIHDIVDNIYTSSKKNDLARFIRMHMKKHYGCSYNTLLTENILNSVFEDDRYTKNRICTEIMLYQSK